MFYFQSRRLAVDYSRPSAGMTELETIGFWIYKITTYDVISTYRKKMDKFWTYTKLQSDMNILLTFLISLKYKNKLV